VSAFQDNWTGRNVEIMQGEHAGERGVVVKAEGAVTGGTPLLLTIQLETYLWRTRYAPRFVQMLAR